MSEGVLRSVNVGMPREAAWADDRADVDRQDAGRRSGRGAPAGRGRRPGLRHPAPRRPGPGGLRLLPRGAGLVGRAARRRAPRRRVRREPHHRPASTSTRRRWGSGGGSGPSSSRWPRCGRRATTSSSGWAAAATTTPRGYAGSAERERPGPYLRVLQPGVLAAGDPIEVVHRPGHGVTVSYLFRALSREPELLPRLLDVEGLVDEGQRRKARGISLPAGSHCELGYFANTSPPDRSRTDQPGEAMPRNIDPSFVDTTDAQLRPAVPGPGRQVLRPRGLPLPEGRRLGVGDLEAGRRPGQQPRRRPALARHPARAARRHRVLDALRVDPRRPRGHVRRRRHDHGLPLDERRGHGVHRRRLRVPGRLRRGRRADREAHRPQGRAAHRRQGDHLRRHR